MTTAIPPTPKDALSEETTDTSQQVSSRLPYLPPRLRHLGSVRELTLGGTGSASDFGATMMVRM